MNVSDNFLKLEEKRVAAKISQAEMAKFLGLSQSQISRYEQEPESVPAGVLLRWSQVCGEMAGQSGLQIDDPRRELNERLKLIDNYASVAPHSHEPFSENAPVTLRAFLDGVSIASRKPRIGVVGGFDAGKSRLLNVLLGGDRLPTKYQPATSANCWIRHTSEKPAWIAEEVWMMRQGFNFDRIDDMEHCLEHKMFAGGYDALRQYGTHTGAGREHKAFAAIIFIDSPLLLGADLVDLPGYGHSSEDKDRAEIAQKMVDVLIYASPATGFLNQLDLMYLSALIRTLPCLGTIEGAVPAMRNLCIVATHAHHVNSSGELKMILDAAAIRSFNHLDNAVEDRSAQVNQPITQEDFRSRLFTFSADDAALRKEFEEDLKDLLVNVLRDVTRKQVNSHVVLAKLKATESCGQWIAGLQMALDERETAQAEITEVKKEEPNRLRKKAAHEQKINGLVTNFASESEALVTKTFEQRVTVSAIESMIRHRYEGKKEAQQLAASHLIDTIQKSINDGVRVKANELGEAIDLMLDGYGPEINKASLNGDGINFNARVAFMSAMSGLGTIGALAAWASIAAAGSNLGAYILIARVVGWLSSIGVSIGSAGTVMAFVSSIGGPVTLGIAAAVAVALGIYSLFGDSWQTKLAKKIFEGLVKERAQEQMQKGIAKYWADTKTAFDTAIAKTEEAYQAKLHSLDILAFSTKRDEIEAELIFAKETRDFFAGMPWRIMRS